MLLFRYLVFFIYFSSSLQIANASDRASWMDSPLSGLKDFFGCIEVPKFPGYTSSEEILSLDNNNQWVSTGIKLEKNLFLKMDWSLQNATVGQSKYRVMYRIDPRFAQPQIFIQKYNRYTGKYVSDFHHFKDGQLTKYQDFPEMTFEQRIIDYTNYFNFYGRTGIRILAGDVININLDHRQNFFASDSEMRKELGKEKDADLLSISTRVPGGDNRIFYNNVDEFCQAIGPAHPDYNSYCQTIIGKYQDSGESWDSYVGNITTTATRDIWRDPFICADSATGRDNQPVCNYDQGRGMIIAISGTEIKSETEKFTHIDGSEEDFFYHRANNNGFLEFKSPWSISGIYNIPDQLMIDWANSGATDYLEFLNYMAALKPSIAMNYLYTGRYLMEIEIGSSTEELTVESLRDLNVEYYISNNGAPPPTAKGTPLPQNYRDNAYDDGYLWLRVVNNNTDLSGNVKVRIANYTGMTWLSDLVGNKIVAPIRNKFQELSELLFRKMVNNPGFKSILRACLTLYICIYGLMFLAGALQITVSDIVSRVVKIAIVVALLTETSWRFFNENLFVVFTQGTEYLITLVSGSTSSVNNMFGFLDPLIKRYLNWEIWALLLIQLLQIHSGLFILSIMSIYAIMIYFKAALQIIIGYCIAVVCISVMISLAPLFIILILFERTKSMFDSWLSMLLSQMLQPMLLMIFFLLIDQILSELVLRLVVRACWGTLFSLVFSLDLSHIFSGLEPISFSIPFLSEIPFFVPQIDNVTHMDDFFGNFSTIPAMITATFIFLIFVKFTGGLMDYVNSIGQAITGAAPPKKNDRKSAQGSQNPVDNIMGDMKKAASPVTDSAKKLGGFAKEKFIDQKVKRKAVTTDSGKINYGKSDDDSGSDGGKGWSKPSSPGAKSRPITIGAHRKAPAEPKIRIGSHRAKSAKEKPIIGNHRAEQDKRKLSTDPSKEKANKEKLTIGAHREKADKKKLTIGSHRENLDKKKSAPDSHKEKLAIGAHRERHKFTSKLEKDAALKNNDITKPQTRLRRDLIAGAKKARLGQGKIDLLDKAFDKGVKLTVKKTGLKKEQVDRFGKAANKGLERFHKSRDFDEKDVDKLVTRVRKNINKLTGKYDLTDKDTKEMGDIAEHVVRKGAKMYGRGKTQRLNTIKTFPKNSEPATLETDRKNEDRPLSIAEQEAAKGSDANKKAERDPVDWKDGRSKKDD